MADDDKIPEPVTDDVDDTATETEDTETTDATESTSAETDDSAGGGESGGETAAKPRDVGDAKPEGIDWKAMARKWEKRAKENAEAKKRLDTATNADKSEMDKLRESIETLKQENETNKLRAMRADTARKTGVPVELLSATTEEDLAEQAEAILEFVSAKTEATTAAKPKPKPESNGTKPKEKLRSGAESGKSEPSREEILAAVLGKGRKQRSAK